MSECFAGGHLRFLDGEWRDDDGNAIEISRVRHGYWISFLDGDSIMPERYYKCSCCGRVERRKEPYCHCGSRMDGGDGND